MNTYTLIKKENNYTLYEDMNGLMRHSDGTALSKEELELNKNFIAIASLNKIEGVPTLTFDEVVAKEIGYVDINKWILNKWSLLIKNDPLYVLNNPERYKDLYDGYMAGLKDNKERLYTEADIQDAIKYGVDTAREAVTIEHRANMFILSKHKTLWQVEIEMEQTKLYIAPEDLMKFQSNPLNKETPHTTSPDEIFQPKITNNTITITKII